MLNNRIPLPTATGCMRLRSAAHTLGEQYALPRALKGTLLSRFPSHPPLQPQRLLSFSITLVHTIAVLRILLLNVLIPLPSPGSMRNVWKAGEMLGTRWILGRGERAVIGDDKVRNWELSTTGAASVSFAFPMPGRENETRRSQDPNPDGAQGIIRPKRATAAVP